MKNREERAHQEEHAEEDRPEALAGKRSAAGGRLGFVVSTENFINVRSSIDCTGGCAHLMVNGRTWPQFHRFENAKTQRAHKNGRKGFLLSFSER